MATRLANDQLAVLKAAILAETDPQLVAMRDGGSSQGMADFYNGDASPVEKAWMHNAATRQIEVKADYAAFDGLSQGKRDAWALVLQYAPRDFATDNVGGGVNAMRRAIADIWQGTAAANTSRTAILNAVTKNVSRAEKLLGGTATATQSTVTAKVLTWNGPLMADEVAAAMNS